MTNSIYIVFCGTREIYVAERDLQDMTRERTIADLAAGEWGDLDGHRFRVSSIIEIGSDRDVTEEFITAARMQMDGDRLPSRREWEADHRRAYQAAE